MNIKAKGIIRAWHIFLLAGVLGVITLFYQGLYGNPSYIPPVLVNTPAHNFSGPDLYTGETIDLNRFKGKVIVLNFWASWCYDCKIEHPSLLAINNQFSHDPNFVMLGVNFQDKEDLARQYLQEMGNNFQHARDISGRISIDYGVYGVPETFIIDQKGIIRHKEIGPIIGETYSNVVEHILKPLLKGEPISTS